MEIRIPKYAKDLRIKHLRALRSLNLDAQGDVRDSLVFLADFTGVHYNKLLGFTPDTLRAALRAALHVCSGLADLQKHVLPERLEIAGKVFVRIDPEKVGIGWHIDFAACDIERDPVRVACLMFVPEGYGYSDVDDNGNVINPIKERYETFAEHFPLHIFLKSTAFFLQKLATSAMRSTAKDLASERATQTIASARQRLSRSLGRPQ